MKKNEVEEVNHHSREENIAEQLYRLSSTRFAWFLLIFHLKTSVILSMYTF